VLLVLQATVFAYPPTACHLRPLAPIWGELPHLPVPAPEPAADTSASLQSGQRVSYVRFLRPVYLEEPNNLAVECWGRAVTAGQLVIRPTRPLTRVMDGESWTESHGRRVMDGQSWFWLSNQSIHSTISEVIFFAFFIACIGQDPGPWINFFWVACRSSQRALPGRYFERTRPS
jgi:hypothetical protein